MPLKLPQTKSEYAALALAISLILHGVYSWLSGNYNQAAADLSGAFGTVGLPSLLGSNYHVEIRRDYDPSADSPPPATHA